MRRACCGVVCAITGPFGCGVCVRSVFPDSCTLCPQAAASLFSQFCALLSVGLPPPWSKQRDDTIRYDTLLRIGRARGRVDGQEDLLRCCGANAVCDVVVPKRSATLCCQNSSSVGYQPTPPWTLPVFLFVCLFPWEMETHAILFAADSQN